VSVAAVVRARVFARDGFCCVNCGTGERLTVDHIVAKALGGSDALDNLQTLCASCNSRKGTRANPSPPRNAPVLQINLRVRTSTRDLLVERARQEGVSRNDWIEAAVRWALDQPEKTVRITKKV
jgi:5-methylcytosine-specific restriction endonuclease McrA